MRGSEREVSIGLGIDIMTMKIVKVYSVLKLGIHLYSQTWRRITLETNCFDPIENFDASSRCERAYLLSHFNLKGVKGLYVLYSLDTVLIFDMEFLFLLLKWQTGYRRLHYIYIILLKISKKKHRHCVL